MLGTSLPHEVVWRLALLGGMLPSLVVIVFRLSMEEPEVSGAPLRRASTFADNFSETMAQKKYILLGACLNWGLFNVVAYSLNSFSHVLCEHIFGTRRDEPTTQTVLRDAIFALVMGIFALGTFAFLGFIGHSSTKSLQLIGFASTAVLMALSAALLAGNDIFLEVAVQLAATCTLTFLGVSTYLIPSENFPASVRATCVGIAAASGKMGALIGTAIFPSAVASIGLQAVLYGGTVVMLLGFLVTGQLTPKDPDPSHGLGDSSLSA